MTKVTLIILFLFLPILFVNCSQNKMETNSVDSASSSADSEGSKENSDVNPVSNGDLNSANSGNNNSGTSNNKIDDRDCYMNYVSVFPWENDDQDAMNIAPILGATKIGTVPVFTGSQSIANQIKDSLSYLENSHWRFYFIRSESNNGSSSLTAYLNKQDQSDSSNELTCYFGPVFDTAGTTIIDPAAKLVFQNIGVGLNGVDGLTGYLSNKDKFIACKVTKGSKDVVIHGNQNKSFNSRNQNFVIKRGCYQ